MRTLCQWGRPSRGRPALPAGRAEAASEFLAKLLPAVAPSLVDTSYFPIVHPAGAIGCTLPSGKLGK